MILIVDDDNNTASLLARLLKHAGHETRSKACGSELLASLNEPPPSLVILDMMMPNIDGLTCLEAIRSHPQWRDVPVLVYSADSSQRRIDDARKLGAQEYVVKSRLPWEQFLNLINRYAN